MERVTCRMLPFAIADGPTNMARDEVLLQSAARGVTSLRFYGWDTATVSLGYFQRAADRLADPLLADLPFVRRPTGGDALVHHHELTYCLAVPSSRHWATDGPWLHMHSVIAAALSDVGVTAVSYVPWEPDAFSGFLCFHHATAGDVLVNATKVVGSAQRKQRGAHMQHGSILLARSEFAPALPGIEDLTGVRIPPDALCHAIVRRLEERIAWTVVAEDWPIEEVKAAVRLFFDRYANDAWNKKR